MASGHDNWCSLMCVTTKDDRQVTDRPENCNSRDGKRRAHNFSYIDTHRGTSAVARRAQAQRRRTVAVPPPPATAKVPRRPPSSPRASPRKCAPDEALGVYDLACRFRASVCARGFEKVCDEQMRGRPGGNHRTTRHRALAAIHHRQRQLTRHQACPLVSAGRGGLIPFNRSTKLLTNKQASSLENWGERASQTLSSRWHGGFVYASAFWARRKSIVLFRVLPLFTAGRTRV